MRLRTIGLIGAMAAAWSAAAQTTLYQEDFDSPPHSVNTYHSLTGVVPYWNDSSALSVSGSSSYHAKHLLNDTVFFKTYSFSTVGNPYVVLSFDHIAKVHWAQRGYVSVSIDNGQTWNLLTPSHYRGSSTFSTLGYFNELSYSDINKQPYWGGSTTSGTGTPATNAWWVNEIFDISSLVGHGSSGTGNGFSQVLVRFALQYRSWAGTANPSGWWVDNVKVTGSPCELVPPSIKWNYPAGKNPVGERYSALNNVQFRVIDPSVSTNSGVDTAYVIHRINGGPWNVQAVLPSLMCGDSAEYITSLSTPSVGDTVEYYVEVDDCGCSLNSRRDPALGAVYMFYRAFAPPTMCGTPSPGSLPFVVTSVPFVENFDGAGWTAGTGPGTTGVAHRGQVPSGNPPSGRNMEVVPLTSAPGFGWSVRQGPTAPLLTGPAGDHTTGTGNYLYTEASQGVQGAVTHFTTPCIKLDNLNHAALEFYYHKFGAHMGQLRVDIDTGLGFGTGQGVIGAFTVSGATHVSSVDPWNSAVLNLQPYVNKYIRLRFVGTKATNLPLDQGDMAIDDLKLYEASAVDAGLLSLIEPVAGGCSYGPQTNVWVRVANRGWRLPRTLPLAFELTQVASGTVIVQRDTLPVTWSAGGIADLNFTSKANLASPGTYHIRAWIELPNDAARGNDTTAVATVVSAIPISIPYLESFNAPGWYPGPFPLPSGDWVQNPNPLSPGGANSIGFVVGKDLTSRMATGPRWSRGYRGSYMYVDGTPTTTTNQVACLETSRCVDFSTATSPMLTFWFHMYGANCGSIAVDYFSEVTKTWLQVANSVRTGPVQTQETDDWQPHQVALTNLAGQRVRIRIRATPTGTTDYFHMAIDDLQFYDRPAVDLGVQVITAPNNSVSLASPAPITVTVKNYGSMAQSAVPVVVVVSSRSNPALTSTYTATASSVLAGSQTNVTIPGVNVAYTQGDMLIKAYTVMPGDLYHVNDTAITRTNGQVGIVAPFGPLTFDASSYDTHGFFTQGGTGTLEMWELGASQRGVPAWSGTNAWHLGLAQDGYGPNTEYLRFPAILGLDTTLGAVLQFKHRYAFSSGNAGRIEYLDDGVWRPVGEFIPYGANWYQNSDPTWPSALLAPGWGGNTSNQYVTASYPLSFWNDRGGPLYLRARYTENQQAPSYWTIDDIEVWAPPQNSIEILGARPENALIEPGGTTRVQVLVRNDGERPVKRMQLRVAGLGTQVKLDTLNLPQAGIAKGQSAWVTLPSTYTLATPGTLSPCVSVVTVNRKTDVKPLGDTLCFAVTCLPPVAVSASAPYCTSFEAADWPVASFTDLAPSWARALPNHGSLQSAFAGTKAYVTGNAQYPGGVNEALYSPRFTLDTALAYVLRFQHNMQSEPYMDGGIVEYSFDDVNWQQLGNASSPAGQSWCTSPSVSAVGGQSGWSGTWASYQLASQQFKSSNASVRFRFRFASSAWVQGFGWAVDSFCFEVAPTTAVVPVLNASGDVYNSGCL